MLVSNINNNYNYCDICFRAFGSADKFYFDFSKYMASTHSFMPIKRM